MIFDTFEFQFLNDQNDEVRKHNEHLNDKKNRKVKFTNKRLFKLKLLKRRKKLKLMHFFIEKKRFYRYCIHFIKRCKNGIFVKKYDCLKTIFRHISKSLNNAKRIS